MSSICCSADIEAVLDFSPSVLGRPGECPFKTLPVSRNWFHQRRIALSSGAFWPRYVTRNWRCTRTIDLNSAYHRTHCAFCCAVNIVLATGVRRVVPMAADPPRSCSAHGKVSSYSMLHGNQTRENFILFSSIWRLNRLVICNGHRATAIRNTGILFRRPCIMLFNNLYWIVHLSSTWKERDLEAL